MRNLENKRKYQNNWNKARRSEWFSGKVCARCGTDRQLELDHIVPATKVHHRIWSWRKSRRDAELAKCQPLCKACHKIKTFDEDIKRSEHGTLNRYTKYKCKCELCSEAKRNDNLKHRHRKPGPPRPHKRWTPDEDKIILTTTLKEASDVLGRSVSSVNNRRERLLRRVRHYGLMQPP